LENPHGDGLLIMYEVWPTQRLKGDSIA